MRTIFVPIIIVLLSAAAIQAAEHKPELIVEIGAEQVYEGQSVLYRVTLNHVEDPSPPELPGFDDFEVAPLGNRSLNSVQTTIINGRITKIERRGMQYDYRLTPRRAGLLVIPQPVAKVNGKIIKGRSVVLKVVAPEEQNVVFMQIAAEPNPVYPTQPFAITLQIDIKELPKPYADREPVRVQSTPPTLQIPWADDDWLPDGIEPNRNLQRWLGPLENRRGVGFNVNNLGQQDIFSLFDRRPSVFCPRPTRITRPDKNGDQHGYWRYKFTRKFVPKRIGRYEFGPVALKGTFATELDGRGELQGEQIYAVAQPIEFTVKDVPEEGRPESYIGAIGRFQLSGELSPKKAKVGDPMTLTLTLVGEGTLDDAYPPDLSLCCDIADRFKVYEATEEGGGDTRKFTYSLRPLMEGIEEFPSVPVAYFDVNSGKYVTLHTKAKRIEVAKAERLSDNQIVASRGGHSNNGRQIEVRREGIFVSATDLSELRDESVRPIRWLVGLGCMVVSYAVLAVVITLVRRRRGDLSGRRRRTAASRARRRLHNATVELKAGRTRDGVDHVRAAITGLVADMADLPQAGLTPRDVERRLRVSGVDVDLTDRIRTVLEACDAAKYGASDATVSELAEEAGVLLKPLLKKLK